TIPDGRIHSFNKTATFIFEQIESGADSGDIPALLTGEYDVPPETAAADTKELIEKLLELNIIEKNA
ncbi:MAG: PqqD family protein, partial [Fibrobacterota bacterium]